MNAFWLWVRGNRVEVFYFVVAMFLNFTENKPLMLKPSGCNNKQQKLKYVYFVRQTRSVTFTRCRQVRKASKVWISYLYCADIVEVQAIRESTRKWRVNFDEFQWTSNFSYLFVLNIVIPRQYVFHKTSTWSRLAFIAILCTTLYRSWFYRWKLTSAPSFTSITCRWVLDRV